jgi:IclR family pca regulon transcriptional regulator
MSASASASAAVASASTSYPVAPTRSRQAGEASRAKEGASTGSSHRTSQSLRRGLQLIKLFTPERPERGTSELALELGVSPATASRFASTCLELGFLERGRRGYRLTRRSAGPGLTALGALGLSRAGDSVVRELRARTGRTVSLAILDGTEVLYLERRRGYHRGEYRLERGLGAGSRRPASDTAAGRALLGGTPELVVDEGPLAGQARALAITVAVPGERTSAIEVTVPGEAMSAAEMLAELGEPLRAAAAALRAALSEEASKERVAELTT